MSNWTGCVTIYRKCIKSQSWSNTTFVHSLPFASMDIVNPAIYNMLQKMYRSGFKDSADFRYVPFLSLHFLLHHIHRFHRLWFYVTQKVLEILLAYIVNWQDCVFLMCEYKIDLLPFIYGSGSLTVFFFFFFWYWSTFCGSVLVMKLVVNVQM